MLFKPWWQNFSGNEVVKRIGSEKDQKTLYRIVKDLNGYDPAC